MCEDLMRICVDSALALLAVKSMGKNPAGSEVIATPANLTALLTISSFFKDDLDASNEALKCIANALLLIESARSTFVKKEVGGSEAIMELLEVRITSLQPVIKLLRGAHSVEDNLTGANFSGVTDHFPDHRVHVLVRRLHTYAG